MSSGVSTSAISPAVRSPLTSGSSPAAASATSPGGTPTGSDSTPAASSSGIDACALLMPAEIAQATGLTVGAGVGGPPPAGTLGACSWVAGASKVVLSLVDTQHIETTLAALDRRSSGTDIPGIGTKAKAVQNAQGLGGGLNVFVEDASGGFAVSVLTPGATQDQVVALATLVEGRPGVEA